MYICLECGNIFESAIKIIETHGFQTPPYEEYTGSPCCGEPFVKAYECDECGEYIKHDYIMTKKDIRICDNCYDIYEIGDEG